MEKFKIGDRVFKARWYKRDTPNGYCRYGGDEFEVPLGTIGIIKAFLNNNTVVVSFNNKIRWSLDESEIDLLNPKITNWEKRLNKRRRTK